MYEVIRTIAAALLGFGAGLLVFGAGWSVFTRQKSRAARSAPALAGLAFVAAGGLTRLICCFETWPHKGSDGPGGLLNLILLVILGIPAFILAVGATIAGVYGVVRTFSERPGVAGTLILIVIAALGTVNGEEILEGFDHDLPQPSEHRYNPRKARHHSAVNNGAARRSAWKVGSSCEEQCTRAQVVCLEERTANAQLAHSACKQYEGLCTKCSALPSGAP